MSHVPARRRALRLATVLSLAATATVLGAAPAFAHVTAQPGDAAQGSYSVVSLRVPNESDTAGTVKFEVTLPADHPLSSVRTTPVPGWTASTGTGGRQVGDDHRRVDAKSVADTTRRCIGVDGQQHEHPGLGRVRGIDAGRRADEAVPGLGDHERRTRADDPRGLAEITSSLRGSWSPASSTACADASTSPSRTTRPSAFETAFCATTRTSPSLSSIRSRISDVRSSPSRISGRPSTGRIRITAR